MAKVIKTPEAKEDIYEIWHYIAVENHNPENGEKYIDALDDTLFFLAQNPGIGIAKSKYLKGLKQYVFGNYLIFYFPIESGIEVVRVIHGMRDIEQQFE